MLISEKLGCGYRKGNKFPDLAYRVNSFKALSGTGV